MGKKLKKSTIKFMKKGLVGDAIKRRKAVQKIAKGAKIREEKKAKRIEEHEKSQKKQEDNEKRLQERAKRSSSDMNVDEFMEKGFFDELDDEDDDQVLEEEEEDDVELSDSEFAKEEKETKKTKGKKNKKEKQVVEDQDEDDEASKDLKKEIAKHKKELEKLKEQDPEFAEFLAENDEDLLNFQDEEDIEMEAGDVGEESAELRKVPLTMEQFKRMEKDALEQDTIGPLRKVLVAFRSACNMGKETNKTAYNITEAPVFNEIITFCFGNIYVILDERLFGDKGTQGEELPKPQKSPKWKNYKTLVNSFLGNVLTLFSQLTDIDMVSFVLQHFQYYIPYFAAFPKLYMKTFRALLDIWQKEQDNFKLYSFLAIRDMVIAVPFPFIEYSMKHMYMAFARESSVYHAKNSTSLALMINCLVELYSINAVSAYQHAFIYIRQIAIALRTAITEKTKEAMKKLYNWTVINCLRFWVRLISSNPQEEHLRQLIYPLCHIITGVISFIPTSKYAPLRFTCVQFLLQLANTGVFVNPAPHILQTLTFPEVKRNGTGAVGKVIDFRYALQVGPKALASKSYQATIVNESVASLTEFFKTYCYSIGFPELAFPAIAELKKFAKDSKLPALAKKAVQLAEQLSKNSDWISAKRRAMDFAPATVTTATEFIPNKHEPAPFDIYYQQWKKSDEQLKQLQVYDFENERDDDKDLALEDDEDAEEDQEDDDEEDEEEEAPKPAKKAQKKSKPTKSKSKKQATSGDDIVGDFVLSDDE